MSRAVLASILFMASLLGPTSHLQAGTSDGREHDRFVTQPTEAVREFRAFKVSFDTDADGIALGVPDWVAYELRRNASGERTSHPRPSRWFTDDDLHRQGIAPDDSSYRNSGYSRGHLCMKSHAGRLGPEADRETHTVLNACPQMQRMNGGIWLAIENLTGRWADEHDVIWIVTGPVFTNSPKTWIGDPGEIPVAVPDAFFKLAIRHDGVTTSVLAFLVPMYGDQSHSSSKADVRPYLTSVDVIESLTDLDFLSALPDSEEDRLERSVATRLWEAPSVAVARTGEGARGRTPKGPITPPRSEPTRLESADPDVASTRDVAFRAGRNPSPADRTTADGLLRNGWNYVMPRPKSSRAAWGNPDARTTWWSGHWLNGTTGRASMTQPSTVDGYDGDGITPGWRRGGAPADPSDVEWLCSTSGGPPSVKP